MWSCVFVTQRSYRIGEVVYLFLNVVTVVGEVVYLLLNAATVVVEFVYLLLNVVNVGGELDSCWVF